MKATKLIMNLGLGVALLLPTSSLSKGFDKDHHVQKYEYKSHYGQKHHKKRFDKNYKGNHYKKNRYSRNIHHKKHLHGDDIARIILAYGLLASLH